MQARSSPPAATGRLQRSLASGLNEAKECQAASLQAVLEDHAGCKMATPTNRCKQVVNLMCVDGLPGCLAARRSIRPALEPTAGSPSRNAPTHRTASNHPNAAAHSMIKKCFRPAPSRQRGRAGPSAGHGHEEAAAGDHLGTRANSRRSTLPIRTKKGPSHRGSLSFHYWGLADT
jgi:hypothetical protein